jgi:hypothetical protein
LDQIGRYSGVLPDKTRWKACIGSFKNTACIRPGISHPHIFCAKILELQNFQLNKHQHVRIISERSHHLRLSWKIEMSPGCCCTLREFLQKHGGFVWFWKELTVCFKAIPELFLKCCSYTTGSFYVCLWPKIHRTSEIYFLVFWKHFMKIILDIAGTIEACTSRQRKCLRAVQPVGKLIVIVAASIWLKLYCLSVR